MPEVEEKKTVDIDTSGPGAEIEVAEEKDESVVDTEASKDETTPTDQEPVKEEPVKEDEKLEEYSKGVQGRIAKLTRKMREAERQKDEALRFAENVKRERDQFKTAATSLDKNYATEMEGRITSSLSAAQAKLAAARTNEDSKAEVEALTAISQLGYEQGKLAEIKSQHAMEETAANERPTLQPTPQPQAPARDPKAEAWAEENDWFGKDNAMTYTAFDLHRKLTEEEGMDPQSDEYYVEVDKRIRLEFPHKFGKVEQQTSKPTQNVASATRSSKTGRKTVRLTPTQVTIAKKLGVPLEEYAKQLIITKEV